MEKHRHSLNVINDRPLNNLIIIFFQTQDLSIYLNQKAIITEIQDWSSSRTPQA